MALSDKDLPTIVDELFDATPKWYNIGIQLKLKISKLDSIKKDHKDITDECFPQMIIAWLRSSSQVPKTWSTLANVLKRRCIGFGELATRIEEKFCQPQPQTGEKRPYPRDESEGATKQPCLEEGCKCEELNELLLTKDQQIHELKSQQNGLESSIKDRDAQIQALAKDNKQLRKEKSSLQQRCSEQIEEHSQQLEQLTTTQVQSRYGSNLEYDIRRIHTALQTVKDDWYYIGVELNISLELLDNIKERKINSGDCLFLVLREWVTCLETQGNNSCRWCTISEALTSSLLEHHALVDVIHERCHPQCEPYWQYEGFDPFQQNL